MTAPAEDAPRLGLDTATPFLALALWSPAGGTLASRAPRVERAHAARIVPELDALFAEAGVSRGGIAAVTVGVGPGSYTGVRVGVAAARALATAWGVPLGGASTLTQIAWGGLGDGETGVAALDARRGNVYAAPYERRGSSLIPLAPPAKAPRETWRRWWTDAGPGARWLEDAPPDASWAARRPPAGAPPEPVYE